jgi:hypothetical protein
MKNKVSIRWLSGKELLKRWAITPFELGMLIKEGNLKAYNKFGDLEDIEQLVTGCNIAFALQPGLTMDKIEDLNLAGVDTFVSDLYFKESELVRFESRNEELMVRKPFNETETTPKPLQPDEARELGRLRNEKSKWDNSVEAAVHIGIYCKELDKKGHKITRSMLIDEINVIGFKDLPTTTIEKIWKAIPQKFRKKAGRPPKLTDPG